MGRPLSELYRILSDTRLYVSEYSGASKDAAFDLVSTESFLAGIADSLVAGTAVDVEFHAGLGEQQLVGTVWHETDGESFDLAQLPPEILEHARLLEKVRHACVGEMRRRGFLP